MPELKIRGLIDEFTLAEVDEWLVENGSEEFSLVINSYGGSLTDAWALYALLRPHKPKVLVESVAASAASVLMMAGDERVGYETSEVMIHNPYSLVIGDSDVMQRESERLRNHQERLVNMFTDRLKINRDQVVKLMNEDRFIDSGNAKKMGFFTEIIPLEANDGIQNMKLSAKEHVKMTRRIIDDEKRKLAAKADEETVETEKPVKEVEMPTIDLTKQNLAESSGGFVSNNSTAPIVTSASLEPEGQLGLDELLEKDRDRVTQLHNLANKYQDLDLDQKVKLWVSQGTSIEQAKGEILDLMATADSREAELPLPVKPQKTYGDDREEMRETFTNAILARAGVLKEKEISNLSEEQRKNIATYRGWTLPRIAAAYVAKSGGDPTPMDDSRIILNSYELTASDFPNLTMDVAYKSMLRGYMEQEEVFDRLVRTTSNSDFKKRRLVGLNTYDTVKDVADNAEIEDVQTSDRSAEIGLKTVGGIFSISRRALIDDDTDALTRTPMSLGRSVKRKQGDDFAALFTSNANVSIDNAALFSSTHSNVISDQLATAALGKLHTKMLTQKDPRGINAGFRGQFLYIPASLEVLAWTIMNSTTEIGSGGQKDNSRIPNWAANRYEVVVDYRLDANSTSAYYILANPNTTDTAVVAYLNGQSQPRIDSQMGWRVLGSEWRVVLDYDFALVDYRGFARGGTS